MGTEENTERDGVKEKNIQLESESIDCTFLLALLI
jgi:hypothetical protein